ncbi:MAG: hypothetical protein DRQ14_04990 [Candidatus Latescibacterota bacterium]|nr:MAG: hypothetical protein DRQ14_04990 [Candidatus Latescibacterota bacterium]
MSPLRRNPALWAAGIAICSLAALELAGWALYRRTERLSERDLDSRLRAQARWTALLVGPERAEALVSGEGWAADELAPTLKAASEEGNLENIYFFGPDLELKYDIRGYYRLSGGSFPPFALGPLLRAAAGQTSSSRLYKVGGSYLKSAYAPVRDEGGHVVAVIGVEGSAEYFSTLSHIRRYFVTFGLFGLLLAVAVASLAYYALSWLSSAEEALARAEVSEAMGRMAAQMAHEIRNPLSIVRTAAVRLRSKYGEGVDPKLVDFILEEVDRIRELTDHYLSLSREETINPEPCDLVVLVRDVVEVLPEDGPQVEVDLPPKPVVVNVDPNRIRQVLLNLLSNAEDAVSEVPDPRITVSLRRSRRGAYISVEDNGQGVPHEVREKIFHPFFTTKEKGSGLGLYIVRRIVRAHGGEVHLRSRPGRTSFVVFLPWKPNIR